MQLALLGEVDLKLFVEYWGGNVSWWRSGVPKERDRRSLAAVTFYLLHHPELYEQLDFFWASNVRQMMACIRFERKHPLWGQRNIHFTSETESYMMTLLDLWERHFGVKKVFQFQYQNWYVLSFDTLLEMLAMFLKVEMIDD